MAMYQKQSHPVRGAWVEIKLAPPNNVAPLSHPVRGAWVEIVFSFVPFALLSSHPVRGAWVEIACILFVNVSKFVAPREGCVG